MMRTSWLGLLVVLALGALIGPVVGSAFADPGAHQVRFLGIHPIPKGEGGGICYIEGPHVHIYAGDKIQYRDHHGASYFVGDPVAYGYDGPRYTYKGHHPIQVHAIVGEAEPDVEYCYITGPHFHSFAPPEGPDFQRSGDAYFYVGEPPRAYLDARPAMVQINAMYEPIAYERPVITVEPPRGWIGARVDLFGPGVLVAPGAAILAPGLAIGAEVRMPMPSVHVNVGLGLGVPGVVVHEREVVRVHDNHEHHDNGLHRGHHK